MQGPTHLTRGCGERHEDPFRGAELLRQVDPASDLFRPSYIDAFLDRAARPLARVRTCERFLCIDGSARQMDPSRR